jgi:myo-inositol-1(or 4)-monophosphatase
MRDQPSDIIEQSKRLLAVAKKAAVGVQDYLEGAFRSDMDLGFKRDAHDVVTIHDKASEEKISKIIMAEAPDSRIVGEEGGVKGNGSVCWYVDPIDGTANFARGIASWCVSIGAVIDDQVVAGVILDPIARNLFAADLTGATLNGRPMVSRASPDEKRGVILSSFPGANHFKVFGKEPVLEAQFRMVSTYQTVRNPGSTALNLASVAAGWADATMGFRTNPWDIAAGILLVEQAKGRFVGYRDGKPVAQAHLANEYFAIGNDADYPTLTGVVQGLSAIV